MSTRGEVLRHPINGSIEETWNGWSWPAFFFGVIWLLVKGLYAHFLVNLVLLLITSGFAAPLIWIVYAAIGNDAHKNSLLKKGYLTQAQWTERNTAGTPNAASVALVPKDSLEKIRDLAEMRDKGILTEDEFLTQKTKLLNS